MSAKKGWFSLLFGRGDSAGKPEDGISPARAPRESTGPTSGDWHSGQTLLDDFVVERLLGEGGMGKVYLLKSRTTGTRFAVKRAKGLSEGERRNFLAELRTWIDLPEHANLVPCRFFRTVGDEVLIFAEYVEGGSLKDWIDSRKLYEGGADKTLERILDTAIQFAWGLHCVHELGLVHQDVKPANVMMEKDAQAAVQGFKVRVTDYGLARARATGGERHLPEPGQSILVSAGGCTPAYCSPEQADGRKLDRRTDVWSWGVSVLEMFRGEVTWQSGRVAAQALAAFLKTNGEDEHIPGMPKEVAKLLEGCFREDPAQRWQRLEAVVQNLKGVYRAAVGTEYIRVLGEIEHRTTTPLGAGERRTRQGGSWADPRKWLERALREEGHDPAEAAEIVARHGSSRRGKLVADVAAYDEARRAFERLIMSGRKDLENDLARLCNDAAAVHETADDYSGALALYDRAIAILVRLVAVEARRQLANDLADLYTNKANVVMRMGDNRAAVGLYDRAIEIHERLVNVEGRRELANDLAAFYMNKAVAVRSLGDNHAAVALYDRAIEIRERLIKVEGRRELANGLANLYMNKAVAVRSLGDNRAAVGLYDRAIEILDRLVNVEGQGELANDLAAFYAGKANAVMSLGENRAAVPLHDQAIEIRERLVNVEGRSELGNDLAMLYMNKAIAVGNLGDNGAAVGLYDRAIEIVERLVNVESRRELAHELAKLYMHKALVVHNLGDDRAAVGFYDQAIEIHERLVNVEGRRELAGQLATFYMNKANAVLGLGDDRAAVGMYDRGIAILDPLVNAEGRRELANELAKLYMNKASAVLGLGDARAAVALFDPAIEILERLVDAEGRRELAGDLAWVRAYRGMTLIQLGDTERGQREAREAVAVLRAEVKRTGRTDLKSMLDWTARRSDKK